MLIQRNATNWSLEKLCAFRQMSISSTEKDIFNTQYNLVNTITNGRSKFVRLIWSSY